MKKNTKIFDTYSILESIDNDVILRMLQCNNVWILIDINEKNIKVILTLKNGINNGCSLTFNDYALYNR